MNEFVSGPKAPKDPVKKRAGFFIMRNQEVAGAPQPDGRGIQFIYEDGGRLVNSAGFVGNITDEAMLKMLETCKGFRKLVHSIGVTVEMEKKEESVTFAFQMYGKKNMYGGGMTLKKKIQADGVENLLVLEDFRWSADDHVPGQIRFEFDKPGKQALVSVRLYLNDGYTAPEPEEEEPVNFDCEEYREMIKKSLMQTGNNRRLKNAIEKAERGEKVTISFIGGSITQGAGAVPINKACYAYKTFEGFCRLTKRKLKSNVRYCKAGVGGTPSELGMLRYENDVLKDPAGPPDIVVVEFAVNDEGDETKGVCYDSLVRKIWNGPGKPAVILLFAVFASDWNLQERLKCVGESYDLPMVSTRNAVVEQFYKKRGEGKLVSKSQFFYDVFHPTNIGHRIMADGLLYLMQVVKEQEKDAEEPDISAIEAPLGKTFENVTLIDRKNQPEHAEIDPGNFMDIDEDTQGVERNLDLFQTREFQNNWMYRGTVQHFRQVKPFRLRLRCRALLIIFKDSGETYAGRAEVYVDGEKKLLLDPREVGWNHCSPIICLQEENAAEHEVEIRIRKGDEEKEFTILGFGYVE